MAYVSSDKIIATKGDLIEFRRFCLRLFVPSRFINYRLWRWFVYRHFAVFTESEDSQEIIPEENGDRFTVGVRSPWIHFCPPFLVTRIVEETLRTVCDENGCRVNNLEKAAREKGLVALKPDVIAARAKEFRRKDRIIGYNLLTQNCEHFATLCRYGEAFSLQVPGWISKLLSFLPVSCRICDLSEIMKEVSENEKKN